MLKQTRGEKQKWYGILAPEIYICAAKFSKENIELASAQTNNYFNATKIKEERSTPLRLHRTAVTSQFSATHQQCFPLTDLLGLPAQPKFNRNMNGSEFASSKMYLSSPMN